MGLLPTIEVRGAYTKLTGRDPGLVGARATLSLVGDR